MAKEHYRVIRLAMCSHRWLDLLEAAAQRASARTCIRIVLPGTLGSHAPLANCSQLDDEAVRGTRRGSVGLGRTFDDRPTLWPGGVG
jgi:hypothetical protein